MNQKRWASWRIKDLYIHDREKYDEVKGLVAHVHVKDMAERGGKLLTVAPGEGIIDWCGQLAALRADGYDGFITVETHFGPKVSASRRSAAWVKTTLDDLAKSG